MNALQALNDVIQHLETSYRNLLNGSQPSTLWVSYTEETPIKAIRIEDLGTNFILKVQIADVRLFRLNIQITPETFLIQGQPTPSAIVEGYFCPNGFESLIPLPHPIFPEPCWTQLHDDGLIIQLAKQLRIPQYKVEIKLPALSLVNRVSSLPSPDLFSSYK
jgi:hypothetical protein